MRNRTTVLGAALLMVGSMSDCTCGGSGSGLTSANGVLGLALCDRGQVCGCSALGEQDTVIDFGSPEVGARATRVISLVNDNQPRALTIESFTLEDAAGAYAIVGLRRRAFDARDAPVEDLDPDSGVTLANQELAELIVAFTPAAAGEIAAALTIASNTDGLGEWRVTLRGGGGSSRACVVNETCDAGGACTAAPSCEPGASLDFGLVDDDDIGPDFSRALSVTIENDGASEVFVEVELADDGIAEAEVGDLPGMFGVFSLGELPCTVLAPGATLTVPVFFHPNTAGEFHGELVLHGVGEAVHVPLVGRVKGAHICFRSEDAAPSDTLLEFGEPPFGTVPENDTETRRLWVRNCGYAEELTLSSVTAVQGSSADFTSAALPLVSPAVLPPPDADADAGVELALPFLFTPSASAGARQRASYNFQSSDLLRPLTQVSLLAVVGPPEICLPIASADPLDFGWVAADEAGVGCVAGQPLCNDPKVSRYAEVTISNVGRRACTGITFGALELSNPAGQFSIESNPNPASFALAPAERSAPIRVLFVSDLSEDPVNYFAKLPYAAAEEPDAGRDIDMKVKAGGSPNCDISFQPVSAGNLFCRSESLAFGNVNVGQSKTMSLKVMNTGSRDCKVYDLTGSTSMFTFASTPFVVPVNAAHFLPVTFHPVPPSGSDPFGGFQVTCGQYAVNMKTSNPDGSNVTPRTVAFSGNATQPDIDVIPAEVDFGLVSVGCCSAAVRVGIYNSGDGDLTISSVQVLSSSDPGFSTTQPSPSVVPPGGSTSILARFCAQSVGEKSGVVEIKGADGNSEYYTVSLRAEGTNDAQGRDAFRQPMRPQVDVLWVVDDSGSMVDEQQSLATNFDAFIDSASSLDTDYHIGVTTTLVTDDDAGKLYACSGNPLWITDAQSAAVQKSQFACNVKVSESGRTGSDDKEAALQAGRMALDYPNLDGHNAGFLRDEAKLYLIMVTDEPDQSDGSAQLYVDYFHNLKGSGNPDLLNISAISGPPPDGCPTSDGGNQKGYDAVSAVGGQFRSICTADWSDLIASLGLDVFNARRQFPLSRPATASTLTVQVCADDGGGAPELGACATVTQDVSNGWTFDAALNAVTFHGASIPGPGEHVVVAYTAVCY